MRRERFNLCSQFVIEEPGTNSRSNALFPLHCGSRHDCGVYDWPRVTGITDRRREQILRNLHKRRNARWRSPCRPTMSPSGLPALVSSLIRHLSGTALGVFGYDFARVRRVSLVGHQTLFGSTPRPVNHGGVR